MNKVPRYNPTVGEECTVYFSNDSYPQELKCIPIHLAEFKNVFMIEESDLSFTEVVYVKAKYSYDLRKSEGVIFTKGKL